MASEAEAPQDLFETRVRKQLVIVAAAVSYTKLLAVSNLWAELHKLES
jgi:hypothetical protein